MDPNKTHYGTCAVVGSAGLLLTQDFGEEIDAHDAIFRFNIAPAKGFERHVGSRTTIRMINRHHLGFREFDDEVCLFHTTVDEAMRKYMRIRQKHPHLPNVPMDMSFYKKVVEWNKLETPTNGYFGLKLALMLCDRIDIYGFLRTWKATSSTTMTRPIRGSCRGTQGKCLILDLLQKHADKIRFRHLLWTSRACGAMTDPYMSPCQVLQVEGKECFLKCRTLSLQARYSRMATQSARSKPSNVFDGSRRIIILMNCVTATTSALLTRPPPSLIRALTRSSAASPPSPAPDPWRLATAGSSATSAPLGPPASRYRTPHMALPSLEVPHQQARLLGVHTQNPIGTACWRPRG